MLAYFLFSIYLVSGTLLLHILLRRKKFPFTLYHTTALVFFKIFMGCFYGWVFLHYYGGDDTWNYFNESKEATLLLMQHPALYFREFSPLYSLQCTGYHGWEALLFYVNHFERWFLIKGLGILNLLTGKNYYTDVLWFEFLTLPGPLLLFKLLFKLFPQRSGLYFLLVFFIPSVVFWCSGIRAEALLLLSMALMIYNGYAYARTPAVRNVIGIGAGGVGLLLIRYQFLAIFLPAYIAYLVCLRKKWFSPRLFNQVYLVLGLVFLTSLFLPPAYQLSRPLWETQGKFFRLQGATRYRLDSLEPGPVSFAKILPQAVSNGFLRPYPWEGKHLLQSLSSAEIIFLLAGIFYFFLGPDRKKQISHPLCWLFLYYGIAQIIIIGYTVPFPGAIVRYRTIPLFLLVLFLYAGNPLLQRKLRYWIFKLH